MFYIILFILAIIFFYVIVFKMKGKKRIGCFALSIIPLLFLHTCSGGIISPIPFCYMAGFSGKVIDAETKETISGAAVLAVYYKSVYTVAGSNSFAVDAQEILTDKKGEFKIPWAMRWFVLYRGYTEGSVIIFKPGYGVFPDYERAIAVGVSDTWPPTNKYIVYELPKLKTREEIRSNLPSRPDIPYAKMKNFVRLINEERIGLGFSPLTIPKEGS